MPFKPSREAKKIVCELKGSKKASKLEVTQSEWRAVQKVAKETLWFVCFVAKLFAGPWVAGAAVLVVYGYFNYVGYVMDLFKGWLGF